MKLLITRIVLALRRFQQWLVAQLMFGFLNFLKLFPADGAMRFADWMTRQIGKRLRRHKLMLYNLRRAFPEKSDAELEEIALESWGNMGRLAAEYVFLLDPWWNPAVEAQAIDRAHRIGQTEHVFAYRLIARDTVEEKVIELQQTKRALADAILRADAGLIGQIGREDLELLLS